MYDDKIYKNLSPSICIYCMCGYDIYLQLLMCAQESPMDIMHTVSPTTPTSDTDTQGAGLYSHITLLNNID